MKVLVVFSGNSGSPSPFIVEQIESIKSNFNIETENYPVLGKGIIGYLSNLIPLRKKIRNWNPDIIHAHYGLSGFLALLAKGNHALITTFHGNDINPSYSSGKKQLNYNKLISKITAKYSNHSIFVNTAIAQEVPLPPEKHSIIPCAVDLEIFYPIDKIEARNRLGLSIDTKLILFSSSFDNSIKNSELALQTIKELNDVLLLELKNYTRSEVNLLLNASDLTLLTSYNEGSPQIIKEAMACNCPIVSTDVGDVKELISTTKGCYISTFAPDNLLGNIQTALQYSIDYGRTEGRKRIIELGIDSMQISNRIYNLYSSLVK